MGSDFIDPKILIKRAKDGDKDAFGQLYKIYFVPVFRYVYLRVGTKEEAENIAQEVFLKVYKNVENYNDQGKDPLAYFFTIARNQVIDFYRKKKPISLDQNLPVLEKLETSFGDPETTLDQNEKARTLNAAIQSLNDIQREVVILKFINGFENSQVAEILDKSEEAIRQIQHRALEVLRQKLEGLL